MIALRRTIYLTIQSSLDFEESVHKLIKLNLKPGHETELCHMVVDCCAQQRTYEKFFGLMAQRLCAVNKVYVEPFQVGVSSAQKLNLWNIEDILSSRTYLLTATPPSTDLKLES